MDRRSFVALGTLAAGAAAVGFPALAKPRKRRRPAAAGWKTLLDGRSMDGWTPIGGANWTVADGAVQADQGKGFLVSRDVYGDFQVRVEFWASDDANSGVFIRCTNPINVTTSNAYEVNIYDQRPDPSFGTGAIIGLAKVSPMPKAGGRWSVMDITAKGDRFTVLLNGVKTVDDVQDPRYLHAHGRIALELAQGAVKFRKVQLREL